MQRELLHLYGPFAINTFGLMIVVGLIIFSCLVLIDPRRPRILSTENYINILVPAIIAGLLGGRLLFVLTNLDSIKHFIDIFAIWQGGFSLLGSVIALLLVMPFYFKAYKIDPYRFVDLVAPYLALLQAVARIGCFFGGCCFGIPTSLPFGIINFDCPIPEYMNKTLHPTQLYSAVALFSIFFLLYSCIRPVCTRPGQLFCIYLILMSLERFFIDYWRGDRELLVSISLLSVAQIIALIICIAAIVEFIYLTFIKKTWRHESV